MTTVIYDRMKATFVCDSRWTIPGNVADIFVDDTGFEKIEVTKHETFIFSGDAKVIDLWKKYARSNPRGKKGRPPITGISILIADNRTKKVHYQRGHTEFKRNGSNGAVHIASVAGSGGYYAAREWMLTGCPEAAVSRAVQLDVYTGAPVRKHNFRTGEGSIQECADHDCIAKAMLERGTIMFKDESVVPREIPVQEAMKDPEFKSMMEKLISGKADFSAPCDAMYVEPTLAEEEELDRVLDKIYA